MSRAVVLACVSGCAVSIAQAADVSWAVATDGSWNVDTNWSPIMVPTGADRAILGLSGPYTVEIASNSDASGSVSRTRTPCLNSAPVGVSTSAPTACSTTAG